jgi:internalin A
MMEDTGYVLEDSPEGRSLVVTGPWSQDAVRALARGEADGLVLNYARGFCEGSLELLDGGWRIRRLSVLDRSIADLEPIGRIRGLEKLSVQARPGAVLDLGAHPDLRSVGGEWSLIGLSLGALTGLESVVTWLFDEVDLHAFRDHVALRELIIKEAPNLESLSGLGNLPELAVLRIGLARRLRAIDDVAWLGGSLRELKFEYCPGIDAIDDVEPLARLSFLGISECGDIASLAPIEALTELETFYAWGSTRILNGDLSPLTRLPRLKEIRMRNRRGYKPPVGDLVDADARVIPR